MKMRINTQRQALKALDEVNSFLESHWKEGHIITMQKSDIGDIEDMAENICSTCRRMRRLVRVDPPEEGYHMRNISKKRDEIYDSNH